MSLETKCHALVKKWDEDWDTYPDSELGKVGKAVLRLCVQELESILPKRRPKKRKEVVRYGPPPISFLKRKKKATR